MDPQGTFSVSFRNWEKAQIKFEADQSRFYAEYADTFQKAEVFLRAAYALDVDLDHASECYTEFGEGYDMIQRMPEEQQVWFYAELKSIKEKIGAGK